MTFAEKSLNLLPLISVITATYNAAATVRECLESVRTQEYPNIEHIVIDGASNDGTMDVVTKYESVRSLSEPDDGIYSAWNKGLNLARGEWIAFLGADDYYLPGAVSAYVRLAQREPEALYLSSLTRWVGPNGKSRVIGEEWSWPRFQRYMCTAHVGSMHSRKLFDRYGRYDTSLKIVADYELLLRAGKDLCAAFLPEVTVMMQGGGASDSMAALEETAQVKMKIGMRGRAITDIERLIARQKYRLRRMVASW